MRLPSARRSLVRSAVFALALLPLTLPASADSASLAARAQEALRADRPAEALADFRQLEKLAAPPADSAAAARQAAHAALSALYLEEQQRLILLPAHRSLLAAPDSALAWWAWAQACLRAGDVHSVDAARRAITRLHTLPDTTPELRVTLARAASAPDVVDRLLDESMRLIEPALPPLDADDATLTADQRAARELDRRLQSIWSEQNPSTTSRYGAEESESDPPSPTPAERTRLFATIRQAHVLIERTRDRASQTADAAGAARDRLQTALDEGDPRSADLSPAFNAAVATYDPALQTRQRDQARQRLAKLHAIDLADHSADHEELAEFATAAVEEYNFRSMIGDGFLSVQKSFSQSLALLAARAALVPPSADAAPSAHIAYLDQLSTFTAEGWTLTRAEQRAQARALLALDDPLSAAAVLHASLALAADSPQPDDTALLRALADRSAALTRDAEKSWHADDRVAALSDWHDAARLLPGEPSAWRALFIHARLADGADELALEAAGRLWQLDALTPDEIFQAGSLALSLGRPDWTHVLLSRLPDGGISQIDTQLLRTLHSLHGPAHTQETAQLARLHPAPGIFVALGLRPLTALPPEWTALDALRKKIDSAKTAPRAADSVLPARPVLGDPVLARYDARRRPGQLPPDSRSAAARAAALSSDQAAALTLSATDLPAAALAWARAAGAAGQPLDFAGFAPALAADPATLAPLLDLEPSLLTPLAKTALLPLPAALRDATLRQRQTAALDRLRAVYATAPSDERAAATRAYFAGLADDAKTLATDGGVTSRELAALTFSAVGTDPDRRFDVIMRIPDTADVTPLLATLSQSERANIRARATTIVSNYNQQVSRQISNVLGLESRFSNETINAALDQIMRLPANHPDRATLYNISESIERRREIVVRHAQPIADRAKARREAANLADIALAAARNGVGTWEQARVAAYKAGGDHLARYLASAPGVRPAEIQSALSSGAVSSSWFSQLQNISLTASLQYQRETQARIAEYETRTNHGRYQIKESIYNSRYNASGSGYQSYQKAMQRELDRLYPTGK